MAVCYDDHDKRNEKIRNMIPGRCGRTMDANMYTWLIGRSAQGLIIDVRLRCYTKEVFGAVRFFFCHLGTAE